MSKDTMSFCDGKYTVTTDRGALYALRHGEPWNRDLTGDNLVYWMLVDALALKQERDELAESERSCREDNRKFLAEIDALSAERDALRLVCAEAYQMAGALGASAKALDNLSAASAGAPLPHETFLPVEAPQIDREKVRDAISECLGGSIYCCMWVWSAWGVGTMSQDDFILASEDDEILDELTAAAISAIEAKPESGSAS